MSANSRKWSLVVCVVTLVICVPSLQAGTGSCTDTWATACSGTTPTPNNICANAPCTVKISNNGQNPVAQFNGNNQTYICVSAGQTVNWTTDGTSFSASFSSSATPFSNGVTTFNPTNNSGTISAAAKGTCSQFSMTEMAGGRTYMGDPRVIVHP